MKGLSNLAFDVGLVYFAGAINIPLIILAAAVTFWSEHRELAVGLGVCSVIAAFLTWAPAISNIQDCRAIKSTPTSTTTYEPRIYNGKRYWVPKKVANDDKRFELLEKHCSDFPYNT